MTLDELYGADEIFFTGTASEILPITKIDKTIIGEGQVGEITSQFHQYYVDLVTGKKSLHHDWLSHVNHNTVEI